MPVNLYKGEQNNYESFIAVDNNLFNNPGAWTKVAYFNQVNENDEVTFDVEEGDKGPKAVNVKK